MCTSKDVILYDWYYMTMEELELEDNKVIQERPDGSSDGLLEKLDIDLGDGYKECSNRNPDLHKIWTLEAVCPEIKEPTADEIMKAFNQTKEELYPGKEKLTPKEEQIVYEKMKIY